MKGRSCVDNMSEAQADAIALRVKTMFKDICDHHLQFEGKPEPGKLCATCFTVLLTDFVAFFGEHTEVDPEIILRATVTALARHYSFHKDPDHNHLH